MTKGNGKKVITWLMIVPMFVALSFFMSPGMAKGADRVSILKFVGQEYFEVSKNGSMWTKARSRRFEYISDVLQYLDELNKGEFNDWRLPTKQELYDLFVIFDLKDNGDVKIRIEGGYWLAGDLGAMGVGIWEIGDGCGPERKFLSGGKGYVRAIRP